MTFGDFEPLNSNAATDVGDDHHPDVALDDYGHAVAVWTSTDTLSGAKADRPEIVFSFSTDFGKKWASPALIAAYAPPKLADARAAHVATDGAGTFITVWETTYDPYTRSSGERSRIMMARSTDAGKTWSFPVWLSSPDPRSGSNHRPRIASNGGASWIAVWSSMDLPDGSQGADADIFYARSLDGGATWSRPSPLNTNGATDHGDDLSPVIASDGAGSWVAAWQSNDSLTGGIRATNWILFARSSNGGQTFDPPHAIRSADDLSIYDDGAVDLSNDARGNWVAVFQSWGRWGPHVDLSTARSSDNGRSWSSPKPLYSVERIQLVSEYEPRVVCDHAGLWRVVWWREDLVGRSGSKTSRIVRSHSTDNGETWHGPELISPNALADSGNHYHPALAADRRGDWLAVWDARSALGGTVGDDLDIMTARITEPLPPPVNPTDAGVSIPDGGTPAMPGPMITVGGMPVGVPPLNVTPTEAAPTDPGVDPNGDTPSARLPRVGDLHRCDCSTAHSSVTGVRPATVALWSLFLVAAVGLVLKRRQLRVKVRV